MSNRTPASQPWSKRGSTTFITNDRGHLLPELANKGSAWPDFKGTWDLPDRIPALCIVPTSRSVDGLRRLKTWGIDPQHAGGSQLQRVGTNKAGLQRVGEQRDEAVPSSAADARPESANLPITEGERISSQNQDLEPAVVSSAHQGAEEDRLPSTRTKV